MEFKTSSYRSGLIGLAVAGGLGAGAVGLASVLFSQGEIGLHRPLSLLAFGWGAALLLDLVALFLLLYRSIAALSLRYRLDRNGLVITWGASRLVVPMERIQAIVPGSQISSEGGPATRPRAWWEEIWTGLRAGRTRLAGDRLAHLRTTTSLVRSIVVLTPDRAYVVSPRDPAAFIEAWHARRPLGPTQHWHEEEQLARFLSLPIWQDSLAWSLTGFGLLANLTLHGYLALVYDRLPAILPFHFDAMGWADRLNSRVEILRLPQVALLMLVMDLALGFAIYRRERVAAYLVWSGGLVLQLLVWGAVLTISR